MDVAGGEHRLGLWIKNRVCQTILDSPLAIAQYLL
jgi:hypothetical protein